MKLFGKDLFNFKKEPGIMYDFAQHGLVANRYFGLQDYAVVSQAVPASTADKALKNAAKPKKEAPKKTPKQLFEMKALNANKFGIRADEEYLVAQIKEIKDKLSFLGKAPKVKKNSPQIFEMGGVSYGRQELESILERLQNRRRLQDVQTVLDKYPHTTTELVNKVTTDNSHLACNKAEEFVPDFPREAINAMKEYNEMCIKLCNKKAVFYVIADQKDFEVKNKRRDPILLAQSPFGFFWQVLGAWDKEMIYLGDL